MDKGKSSHASFVENQVISHKIANRNAMAITAGILQYNPIQSAILRNLIGQIFATELDYIGECPQ
jgi:hypothetical protein